MRLTLTGTIVRITELDTRGSFSWRDLHMDIDEDEEYPQRISVQFGGNKASLLDAFKSGMQAKVEASVRGREHNEKVYVSFSGYKITMPDGTHPNFHAYQERQQAQQSTRQQQQMPPTPPAPVHQDMDDDSLPF